MKGEPFHHGNLKEAIIKKAMQTLLETDIENFSLRSIAKELGVSPGAPYRHFKNKEELMTALIEEASSTFMQIYDASNNTNQSDEDRVKLICEAYLTHAQEAPNIYKLVFTDKFGALKSNIPMLTDASGYLLFESLVTALIPDDTPRSQHREISLSCWLLLHGFVSMTMATDLAALNYTKDHVINAVIALARSPRSQ